MDMKSSNQPNETIQDFSNHLKTLRTQKGLSQGELAVRAGITRQAVSSIEVESVFTDNRRCPSLGFSTGMSRRRSFQPQSNRGHCSGQVDRPSSAIRPEGVTHPSQGIDGGFKDCRATDNRIRGGAFLTVPADGYVVETHGQTSGATVRVRLFPDRQAIDQAISVAGCDPAIFLAGEHMRRRKDQTSLVGWTMGSMAALEPCSRARFMSRVCISSIRRAGNRTCHSSGEH